MKKLLVLLLLAGGVFAYFWYIRGINLLAQEDANPLPMYGIATRLPPKNGFEDPKQLRWFASIDMPTPRTGVATAVTGNYIYVLGGWDAFARTTGKLEMFNTKTQAWTVLAEMPHPVHQASVGLVNDKIYVFGGYEGLAETSVDYGQVYDIASNTWKEVKPTPVPVGGAATAVVAGQIHLIGGRSLSSILNNHYVYDPKSDSWSTSVEMTVGRECMATAVVGDQIYIFGGRQGSIAYNSDNVDVFDVGRNDWEPVASLMPRKRSDFVALPAGKQIFIFGGEAPTITHGDVDVFDTETKKWVTLDAKMPHPRHGLAGAYTDGSFFLIGGGQRPGLSVSQHNEVLQLPAKQEIPPTVNTNAAQTY